MLGGSVDIGLCKPSSVLHPSGHSIQFAGTLLVSLSFCQSPLAAVLNSSYVLARSLCARGSITMQSCAAAVFGMTDVSIWWLYNNIPVESTQKYPIISNMILAAGTEALSTYFLVCGYARIGIAVRVCSMAAKAVLNTKRERPREILSDATSAGMCTLATHLGSSLGDSIGMQFGSIIRFPCCFTVWGASHSSPMAMLVQQWVSREFCAVIFSQWTASLWAKTANVSVISYFSFILIAKLHIPGIFFNWMVKPIEFVSSTTSAPHNFA